MKKPTMNDVAKLAGVSQSTVSFVLNNTDVPITEEVKERVRTAAKALQFVPRVKLRNFTKPSEHAIALMIPNVSNFFYMELIKSVNHFAVKKGYSVFTVNTNRSAESEQHYLRLLMGMKVAGIIYGFTPTLENIKIIEATDIPITIIGEAPDGLSQDIVSLNSYASGKMIAEHLVSLKHKNITFISSPLESISLSRKRRLAGILDGVQDASTLHVLGGINEEELDNRSYEVEIGYELTLRALRERPHTTALIAANDMIAVGAYRALREKNIRIPEDISVCGFDNMLFSELMVPSLTTVDHSTHWRCGLAIDILDNKINKKLSTPLHVNYEPQLILRESTAPCSK